MRPSQAEGAAYPDAGAAGHGDGAPPVANHAAASASHAAVEHDDGAATLVGANLVAVQYHLIYLFSYLYLYLILKE